MAEPKWIGNRYQIIGTLGSGGSSKVYSARDRKDPEEALVAVKLLGTLPDGDADLHRELYYREVQALSRLSDPRIVRLLDYGEDEETRQLYLVLEHIDRAEPLRTRIKSWKPTPLQSVDFMLELMPAVRYAHDCKIIHRDINPNNILMGGDGYAKIIDFGVSRVLGITQSGQTVGNLFTRAYASPEQIAGSDATNVSDIYSLAAVLYFMITRKDPDCSRTLEEQFEALHRIPDELLAAAQCMAAGNPEERYHTVNEAMLALANARDRMEAANQVLYLVLTKSVVRGLYEQTVTRTQDPSEARDVIQKALGTGAYIAEDDGQDDGYLIVAEEFSLRCVLGSKEGPRDFRCFTAKSVRATSAPHKIEEWRQNGYRVNAQWRVISAGDPLPSSTESLSGLLDEIDDFFHSKMMERKRRERRRDLVESWRNILALDRAIKERTTTQVEFVSLATTSEGAVIRARLAHEMPEGAQFIDGQLLTVSSLGSTRSIPVGHYLGQEDGCILISRLPGVRLEAIPSAGTISVDERQWAAAWSRQNYALNAVVDNKCADALLPDILLDPAQARRKQAEPISDFFNEDLDESKRECVLKAMSAQDLYVIQGPPGTGKTVVVSEIIAQTLRRHNNARVLLVSQSNVAIDHALQAVARLLPEARKVRIGREELIGHGVEDCIVDRQVEAWAVGIRQTAETYLSHHRTVSAERSSLEAARELVDEARSLLGPGRSHDSGDLEAAMLMLRERFPGWPIKQTMGSLEELDAEIDRLVTVQKGELEKLIEVWISRVGKPDDFEDAYLEACPIIAGTCVGIAGKRNLPEQFDLAIIDEAGRATPSELLIPMVRARRSILVGDHKQLPPVYDHELLAEARRRVDIDPIWLGRSLFEHLFGALSPELRTTLTVQYRMHPHIARLVSQVFYSGEGLETGIEADERMHGWERCRRAVVWCSTSQRKDRHEHVGDNQSKYNLCEASIIEKEMRELERDMRSKHKTKSVAIIAGYQAQAKLLKNRLDPEDQARWRALRIEIDTVDAFQGREQDIVFYSVVRSNLEGKIGFLSDSRRLNVALSRARELLFVVGDHRMLAEATDLRSPNPFSAVIAHIASHPDECTLVEAVDDPR